MELSHTPGVRRFLHSALILGAILFVSWVGLQPPSPKTAQAPDEQFSAARAMAVLARLEDDEAPHSVGSASNEAVRARVVAEFAKSGYQPQVQTAFACGDYGACATVQNVVARLDGAEPGPAVLLSAHYDSVAAGPGASDDGAGAAAVLEIARAMASHSLQRRPIIFLIDDGEEAGLIGARAFVDFHSWAHDIRAAVNIDARGTSGPSFMFETGSANNWAIQLFSHAVAHPATSSIAYTLYKQLPNDTDFSVFKAAGYQGFNFAIIGNEPQYHTTLDNINSVNPASLQHQGDNALSTVLALADSDHLESSPSEAVFFDLFGHATVHWPIRWSLFLVRFAALVFALQMGLLWWTGRMQANQYFWGLLSLFLALLITSALALVVQRLLRLAGVGLVNWIAHPLPIEIAFWLIPAAVVLICGIALTRRASFWGLWAGVWTWWLLFSIALVWQISGFSYVVLIPVIVAAVAGLPVTLPWRRKEIPESASDLDVPYDNVSAWLLWLAVLLPMCAAAIVGFTPGLILYDALGQRGLVGLAALVCLVLTPAMPLCTGLRNARNLPISALPGITIIAAALAIFATVIIPAFSAQFPEHMNIQYWQDSDSGQSEWVVEPASGRLPEPIRVAASFHRAEKASFPRFSGLAFTADAPHQDLAAPTFTILEDTQQIGRRSYRALLRSERGAPIGMVFFPPDSQIQDVRVGGIPIGAQPNPRLRTALNGWTVYSCPDMPPEGIEIMFSLPVGKPVSVFVVDQSYGLPPDGQFLLKARPLTSAPVNEGDVSNVSRRVQIFP